LNPFPPLVSLLGDVHIVTPSPPFSISSLQCQHVSYSPLSYVCPHTPLIVLKPTICIRTVSTNRRPLPPILRVCCDTPSPLRPQAARFQPTKVARVLISPPPFFLCRWLIFSLPFSGFWSSLGIFLFSFSPFGSGRFGQFFPSYPVCLYF